MRVIERGDGARFPLEAFAELGSGDFERDDAIQAGVDGPSRPLPCLPLGPMGARISYGPSSSPEESGINVIQLSLADQKGVRSWMNGALVHYFFKFEVWRRVEVPRKSN